MVSSGKIWILAAGIKHDGEFFDDACAVWLPSGVAEVCVCVTRGQNVLQKRPTGAGMPTRHRDIDQRDQFKPFRCRERERVSERENARERGV